MAETTSSYHKVPYLPYLEGVEHCSGLSQLYLVYLIFPSLSFLFFPQQGQILCTSNTIGLYPESLNITSNHYSSS